MTAKAPGERVWLTYDSTRPVEPGDYLRTATTSRTYLVESNRIQQAGKHTGRQHLICIVMAGDHQVEPDAVIHTIAWYPRTPARR